MREASKDPDQSSFRRANTVGRKNTTSWVTLDSQLTWTTQVNRVWRTAAQRLGVLSFPSPLFRISDLSIRNGVLFYKQLTRPVIDHEYPIWSSAAPSHMSGSCKCCNPSVIALRLSHVGTLVTGKFTRIWWSHSSPTASKHWEFRPKVSWCGEPLSSATWKALVPVKGCFKSPTALSECDRSLAGRSWLQ
jgi:hypothetical protein